jgi:hypothetical protein
LKKPRVRVLCRVSDRKQIFHSKSLRGMSFLQVIPHCGLRFLQMKGIRALLSAAQRASYYSVMKVAFMASIPSIALRR